MKKLLLGIFIIIFVVGLSTVLSKTVKADEFNALTEGSGVCINSDGLWAWTASGPKAILTSDSLYENWQKNNPNLTPSGCERLEPSSTLSEVPSCTPSIVPSTIPSATPTETPVVTETPSSTPSTPSTPSTSSTGGIGNIPSNPSTDTTEAPGSVTCNIPFTSPVLNSFASAGLGSVTFGWLSSAQNIDKFSIRYGYSPDNLVYGEDNIPSDSRSLTINDLQLNSHVWAIVSAWRSGCSEDSNEFDPTVR